MTKPRRNRRIVSLNDPYIWLGRALAQSRRKAGIGQVALAEMIDCHPSSISYYESGSTRIPIPVLVRYCNAVGADVGTLLGKMPLN